MISTRKIGGIRFIKVGRFGCSLWVSKRKPIEQPIDLRRLIAGVSAACLLLVTPCSMAHAHGSHSSSHGEHHHTRGG